LLRRRDLRQIEALRADRVRLKAAFAVLYNLGRSSRVMVRAGGSAVMYYEDVKIQLGETLSGLANAYGHTDWKKIWDDPRNAALKAKRGVPNKIQPGDILMVPIPWRITSKTLTIEVQGVGFEASRDGGKGTRLSWVQTVFQDNQAVTGTTAFCVDGCPADDDLPFYWTEAELTADPGRRTKFIDHPSRGAPTADQGTTHWRAITSLAVVTGKRITVFDSWVWGFNLTPANAVTKIGPRAATGAEFAGHLNLLKKGVGTGTGDFTAQGWTFRAAP